jgi:magnesium chelatase subunit D
VPRGGARLALVETLRAAAPWQRLRGAGAGAGSRRVVVRRDDLRVQRREQRRGTTTIFVIDASGSQAAHRLAEAKGAVELLLADCYARRDRVAVIGFRGAGAQVLLPQTRSLVRARRQLAGLPGGGGTPLAAGIDAATAMVASVRREGSTPLVVMLTDGKANVGRGGEPGRAAAAADALAASRAFAATAAPVLVIDTSPQPGAAAAALAQALGGRCIALPYAGALAVSRAVRLQRDAGPGTAPRRPPGPAPGGARDAR